MSILEALKQYASKSPARWHTPGHKGRLNPFDVTELSDDSFPGEFVELAQNKAAKFYGAKAARFLTGGSSMGIKAAILAADCDVLAPKGCHRALSEGTRLAGRTLYTFDTGTNQYGLPNPPAQAQLQDALRRYPTVGAVYLESPDYYGRVVDPKLLEIVRNAGKYIFCDAAHGAHFPADQRLRTLSYAKTADVCNLSAHKTLNAYTQAAYLCVNRTELEEHIDCALTLLGTTSPSYLLLASLETAIDSAGASEADYERLYVCAQHFFNKIPCMPTDDFTRMVVHAGHWGLTGEELCRRLVTENVFAEKYEGGCAVFIATPHETEDDFEYLTTAVLKAVRKEE